MPDAWCIESIWYCLVQKTMNKVYSAEIRES